MSVCQLCGEAGEGCGSCGGVSLCPGCRPRHKRAGKCLPWGVSRQEGVGRCLVATRDIKPLEIVLEDTAFVCAPQVV